MENSDMLCNCGGKMIPIWGNPFRGRPLGFTCELCGKHEGYFNAIGRMLFPIQSMPPGAIPFYDKIKDADEEVTKNE